MNLDDLDAPFASEDIEWRIQQAGKNIIAAFAAAGLLNNIGNQTHGKISFHTAP